MVRLAVFASGNGSNLAAILHACETGALPAEISLVVSDQPQAKALLRAQNAGITTFSLAPKACQNKVEYEQRILQALHDAQVDWLVLAGYLRLIGTELLAAYPQKIVNIHPSLLPAFPGLHSIERAVAARVPETGVTIHYVDAGLDTGPIIAQEKIPLLPTDTLAEVEAKVHQVEHQLYPRVLRDLFLNTEQGAKNE